MNDTRQTSFFIFKMFGFKEFIFALFLAAGDFKGDPRLAWLPVDLTLLTALLTFLFVAREFVKSKLWIPKPVLMILPFFILFLPTLFWTEWQSYATDKTIRFFTLTMLAALAPAYIIKSRKELFYFLNAIALLGAIMAAGALFDTFTSGAGLTRMTAFGSTTIALGRAVGISIIWLALIMFEGRINFFLMLSALGVLGVVLLGSGSRGPLLTAIVTIITTFILFFRPSPAKIIRLFALVFVCIVVIQASLNFIPETSLGRVADFLKGDLGKSELQRFEAYKVSWEAIQKNPMGIGLGGFATKIDFWPKDTRQYPHNIIIESSLEGGLLTGFYIILVFLAGIYKCYRSRGDHLNIESGGLFALILFLILNAMVSGDLNDNKMLFALLGIAFGLGRGIHEKHKSGPPDISALSP